MTLPLRVRGGAWHHGWRWKVWFQIGERVMGEAGLGRAWFSIASLHSPPIGAAATTQPTPS